MSTEESPPQISLRDYIDMHITAIEKNMRLMEEQRKLLLGMVHAESDLLAKNIETRFLAIDKATALAAAAIDRRLESMNEFRAEIAKLQGTFMPRLETMALLKAVDDRIEAQRLNYEKAHDDVLGSISDMRVTISHTMTIEAHEARYTQLQQLINDLRESRSESSGKFSGASALWGYIVAIAGIALALVFHFIK